MNSTETTAPAAPLTTNTPRIYVASLSDYNAGKLLGRWIDASQDAAEIHAEIQDMLAESNEAPAEEWAIHDYEGFGEWRPREYESIDTVAAVTGLIAEHGEIFTALLSHFGGDLDDARRWIEGGARGCWRSLREFAEEYIGDVYAHEINRLPDFIQYAIDYDQIGRDMEMGGDIFTIELDGMIHVFDATI
jgi:antirestriction protein